MAKKKQNLPDNAGLQYGYAKQDNVRRMTVLPTSELRTNNLSLNPVDDFANELGLKPEDTTNKTIPPISTPNSTFERIWTEGDDDRMDVSGERILPPKLTRPLADTGYRHWRTNPDLWGDELPNELPGINDVPPVNTKTTDTPSTNNAGTGSNSGNNGGLTPSIQWEQELASLYDRLANLAPPKIGDFKGPTFNYDYRDDPSYQQYRQQYVRNGQLAMQDTMGQAAGLTGGYGSSYSQNVGQQAYQGYMNQLNAVVPELYQNAYNRYLNDYSNQYNEWRDKYSAELDAYKAQLSNIGTQYDFINNEIARNTPQGYSVDDIVKLYKAGLGVDENGNYYELPTEAEQSGTEAQNATPSTTSNVPAEERNYTGKIGSILNSDIRMGKDAGGNTFMYTASKNQTTQDGRRKAEVIDREIDEAKRMPGYPAMGTKEQQAQFIVTALRQQGYSDLEISYVLETLDEE